MTFRPFPFQEAFAMSTAPSLLLQGYAGGGKSAALLYAAVLADARSAVFYPSAELLALHVDTVRAVCLSLRGRENRSRWIFPSGATVELRTAVSVRQAEQLQGKWDWIGFDYIDRFDGEMVCALIRRTPPRWLRAVRSLRDAALSGERELRALGAAGRAGSEPTPLVG